MTSLITDSPVHIVLIDNFDSFTYNLVDQFRRLGFPVTVFRHHLPLEFILSAINDLTHPVVVLSPGPGAPADAGCMPALIMELRGRVPMIGICLGHQALIEAYGGVVGAADEIVHGKAAELELTQHPVYQALPERLIVARYHSLVATTVPPCLDVIARVAETSPHPEEKEGAVMAVVNNQDKAIGFQFHPESILTTHGAALLTNTIKWAIEKPIQGDPRKDLEIG